MWSLLALVASVNLSNRLMLEDWIWRMQVSDTKNLEEGNFDYRKDS